MKNTQKGSVGIILIVILILILGIGGTYFVTNKNEDVVVNATSTTVEITAKENASMAATSTQMEPDIYQNGTYPGIIKSVYKNNNGSVSVDVDFYQIFTGKRAFLELAKKLYYEKDANRDEFTAKYPTYSVLEKTILPMSEKEFDNMFAEWDWTKRGDNRVAEVTNSIIGGNFYKGLIYSKNESTKIRTFTLDKDAIIDVDINQDRGNVMDTQVDKDNVKYEINQDEFVLNKIDYLESDFDITIKGGLIVKMIYVFKR